VLEFLHASPCPTSLMSSYFFQSQFASEMDYSIAKCEAAVCNYNPEQACVDELSTQLLRSTKSVGNIDDFWGSYAVVCRFLSDYCMEVLWNAVFYDTIAEYTTYWRKSKRWFSHPYLCKKIEELPNKPVCWEFIQVFFFLVPCI